MASPLPTDYPFKPQGDFARLDKVPLVGELWEGELLTERPTSMVLAAVTPVAGITEITIAANNPGDQVGTTISGGTVPVVAGANADATAALLGPKILAAAFATTFVDTATVLAAVVTVTGVLGKPLDLVEYSPDATTAAVNPTTAAVVQQELCYGMGVVKDIPTLGINKLMRQPSALTDQIVGVVVRTPGSNIPVAQIQAFDPTYNPAFLMPGQAYTVGRENVGVMVHFSGADPLESDPVYLTMVGVNAGWWTTTDGATAQVTQGDVEFNGVEVVGLTVDALPDLAVASNTSDDQTAADLRDAWNNSFAHVAVAVASIDTSGAESLIILSFLDNGAAAHTVVAVSPATADIVAITNTATAVAATAKLIARYSWGRPTISAAADVPARAFLRLSVS